MFFGNVELQNKPQNANSFSMNDAAWYIGIITIF